MSIEWPEYFKHRIGLAIDDFFRVADNGDGTLAFDWCSSDDIDALAEKVLETLGGEQVAMVRRGDIAGSTVIVPHDAAYLDHPRAVLIKLEG